MLQQLAQAWTNVMTLEVMGYITLGLFIGYIVGVLPGLSRATAIALLIPITYKLPPLAGISFLIGVSKGGNTGSALTAILINVPGEPQSVVTALDGMPDARLSASATHPLWVDRPVAAHAASPEQARRSSPRSCDQHHKPSVHI